MLALVLRELKLQVFHRSAHTFQHVQRNLEFAIASGANRNRRRGPQPFEHAEIAFRHGAVVCP